MKDTNTTLRRLCWRVFVLLVLLGGTIFVTVGPEVTAQQGPDCSWQFDTCTASATSACTTTCQAICPAGDNACVGSCVLVCAADPLGTCVSSREACVASGGVDSGCDGLFSTCSKVSDSAAGACFGDYAQCLYSTNVVDRSQWLSQEYDLNCVADAQAEYSNCLAGGNPGCVSQITGTIFPQCCMSRFRQDYKACLIY